MHLFEYVRSNFMTLIVAKYQVQCTYAREDNKLSPILQLDSYHISNRYKTHSYNGKYNVNIFWYLFSKYFFNSAEF